MGDSVDIYSAAKTLSLLGETVVGATVTNGRLILTLRKGTTVDAGPVMGDNAAIPTAIETSYSPTGTIGSTNLQAALSELGSDVIALNDDKLPVADVPKILTGTVTQPSNGANTTTAFNHSNVFPAGYFSSAPNVVLQLQSTAPETIISYALDGVSTRSFVIVHMRTNTTNTTYGYIAVGN